MIVKNEEDALGKCLSTVKGIPDEIIVVDTGSSDRTKEIAAEFTDKIYDFVWINDFSAARNFAFSKAEGDYILWLDADDILLPEDRKKFLALKEELDSAVDVYMMKYCIGYDGKNAVLSYYRERLVKRSRGFRWHEPVHEYLEIGGKVVNTDICVAHSGKESKSKDRNLMIYKKAISEGKELSPRGLYYYGRELKDNGYYSEAAAAFGKFLDGGKGWVEDNIIACSELAECLKKSGSGDKELPALLRSFSYDTPRAEICCRIGYYFFDKRNYRLAVYWFELCLSLKRPEQAWGFQTPDCWGYIPGIQLAVCYDRLGDYRKASGFNELAAQYKPDSPAVLQNREYFRQKLSDRS